MPNLRSLLCKCQFALLLERTRWQPATMRHDPTRQNWDIGPWFSCGCLPWACRQGRTHRNRWLSSMGFVVSMGDLEEQDRTCLATCCFYLESVESVEMDRQTPKQQCHRRHPWVTALCEIPHQTNDDMFWRIRFCMQPGLATPWSGKSQGSCHGLVSASHVMEVCF